MQVLDPLDRYARYRMSLSPELLMKSKVHIVGCGAVGRQVALTLAGMGIGEMYLHDHDQVNPGNLGTQGWKEVDIGQDKVSVLGWEVTLINTALTVKSHADRVCPETPLEPQGDTLFMCVDDMDAREYILTNTALTTFDVRMGGESCIVYSLTGEDHVRRWYEEWFPQREAEQLPCGYQSTLFCGQFAAALVCSQFSKHLRGISPEFRVSYNLLSNEVEVVT